jgi:hypothetical protein
MAPSWDEEGTNNRIRQEKAYKSFIAYLKETVGKLYPYHETHAHTHTD